jgi:hypothetical protein
MCDRDQLQRSKTTEREGTKPFSDEKKDSAAI